MGKGKKSRQERQQQVDHNYDGPAMQQQLPNLTTPKQFYKFAPGKIHPQIDKATEELVTYINKHIKLWEQNNKFSFILPESQFDLTRQTPVIKYVDQEKIVDNVEPGPLSDSQKKSLYETGTFVVNSKKYSIPYKWLVHSLLYVGTKDRRKAYLKILSLSFVQMFRIKQHILGENSFSFSYIWKSLKDTMMQIVDIFIGRPFKNINYSISSDRVLQIQRQLNINKAYGNEVQKSLNYLYFKETQQKDEKQKLDSQLSIYQINRIQTEWNFKWKQLLKEIKERLEEGELDGELYDMEQRLEEQKYKLLYSIQSSLRPDLLQHLHYLLKEQEIIKKLFRKMKSDNTKAKAQLEKELKSHQLKSRCKDWYNKTLSQRLSIIYKQNYQNTLEELQKQLKTPFIKDYVLFCKNYDSLNEIALSKTKIESPIRGYHQSYRRGISKVIPNPHVAEEYLLEAYGSINWSTDQYFWRFKFLKGFFIQIFNEMIHRCIYNITVGPNGLKFLTSSKKFPHQEDVDRKTGIKKYSENEYYYLSPLRLQIKDTYNTIKKNREEFESAPDTGFMKKSYGRIFNLAYCYLFLGLGKMIIGQCILRPLLSVFLISFCTVLLIFSVPVTFIITVGAYIFGLYIYRDKIGDYNYATNYAFPFPYFILCIIGNILKAIWITLCILLFRPILSLMFVIIAITYRIITTTYYELVFSIIKVIARSPTSDSKIAWRTEGPGISKNFSQKINPDDIYILFLAQCQKIHLNLYQQRIITQLNSIIQQNNSLVEPILGSFQCTSNALSKIQQSINFYTNKLRNQCQQRMRIYPILHNSVVRFTQEELNEYTGNCIEMVQFFMVSHDNCDFYQYFGIDKNNSQKEDLLVIAIWQHIFGNQNVFEAYQDSKQRYKVIQDDRDESQTLNMMDQINTQHKFKKSGHKKFKYYSNNNYEQSQYQPTSTQKGYRFNCTDIPSTFAPIDDLVRRIRQVNYMQCKSRFDPLSSVLLCPDVERFAHELQHLK